MKVKGFDEVCVVERSSAHGSPREGDGIEVRHGSHSTSASDLEVYGDKPCLRLLGLVLVGNCPAWCLGRVAKFFLLSNRVDLEHYAIGRYGSIGTCLLPVVEEGEDFLQSLTAACCF